MQKTISLFLAPLFLAALSGCAGTGASNGQNYYLDASTGSDAHDGRSPDQAWKSLDRVDALQLQPGDSLLLRRGTTFQGTLRIQAQGTSQHRIVVDAYGEGEKPAIVAPDSAYHAVLIENSDYVTLQHLDIANTGTQRLGRRTGVHLLSTNYGVSHSIVLNALDIHDVNGSLVKAEGGGSGILIENRWEDTVSVFDSLRIENCTIRRCERNAMIWSAPYRRDNWHPSTHTVVRNNLIEEVPGDGIVPIGCDSTLIEYNVMRHSPDILPETEAAAGIWPWSCDNTLIQFNEVSDHKAPWDAQGFDSDYNCRNTTIQYNYSHDNYGGMVLVCNFGSATLPENIGNHGTVIRYNVSINDGLRPKPTRGKMFSPAIHISGPVKNTLIEHNIVHLNRKTRLSIDRTMIESDSWEGYADSTVFRGNFFYAPETSSFKLGASTGNRFEGNYYLGSYQSLPADPDARLESRHYQQQILAAGEDGRSGIQSLLVVQDVADGKGTFVDKEAVTAFFNAATN